MTRRFTQAARAALRRTLPLLVAAVAFTAAAAHAAPKAAAKGYDYYLTGSADDATASIAPARPTAVLMGGGTDVDAAFQWMIAKAGGGDFVVIRASGADGYNAYLYAMGGLDSVETLVIKTRDAAADPFVLDRVSRAEAIFIAGGDQKDYITLWKGTALEAVLNQKMAQNVPIGGTSAGLAVLGRFDFSALNDTVTSADAMADPYGKRVTLDRGFLAAYGLADTITDSHFGERDRMGRLLTFLARLMKDGWAGVADVRGLGIDAGTALLVEDGVAHRVGSGSAYFLRPTMAPAVCQPRTPLTLRNVMVERLSGTGSFDLVRWRSSPGATLLYDQSVESGVLSAAY